MILWTWIRMKETPVVTPLNYTVVEDSAVVDSDVKR
jgi:hypothetical protein